MTTDDRLDPSPLPSPHTWNAKKADDNKSECHPLLIGPKSTGEALPPDTKQISFSTASLLMHIFAVSV
jgi:hypothetical protein